MEKTSRYRPAYGDTPHDRFIDQFEWEGGDDWLYRHRMTGAAYRVTDAEKDAFVDAFDKRQRWFMWIGLTVLAGFVAVIIVTAIAFPQFDGAFDGSWVQKNGLLPAFAILLSQSLRLAHEYAAFRAPVRFLEKRVPVAPALSRGERRRFALERLELSVLVGAATAAALLLLFFALERPAIGALGWTVILASGTALTWAVVQGTRKWMLTRTVHAASSLT